MITFSLLTENETFRIDSLSGEIYLMKSLDREQNEEYYLTVSANDGSWKSQTIVTIYVLDENDCVPQFDQDLYEFTIAPDVNFSLNESFGKVQAHDQDKDKNGLVTYQLKNKSKYFRIDPINGEIFVKKLPKIFPSDQSFLNHHILSVVASDSGVVSHSKEVEVLIRLRSMTDRFLNNISVCIPENLEANTPFYTFNAIINLMNRADPSQTDLFDLVKSYQNQLLFDNYSKKIQKGRSFVFSIDAGYEIFRINLTIIGKNQHAPKFIDFQTSKNLSLVSEKWLGEQLLNKFYAMDQDEDDLNNQIVFSMNVTKIIWNDDLDEYLSIVYRETYPELFNQNLSSFDIIDRIDELSHIRNPFDINPMDGSLYLKYYVDYEIITGYSLLISVKDQAWYPMESVYPYEIRVSDDDDFIGYSKFRIHHFSFL